MQRGGLLFTQRRSVGFYFLFFLHHLAQELDTIPLALDTEWRSVAAASLHNNPPERTATFLYPLCLGVEWLVLAGSEADSAFQPCQPASVSFSYSPWLVHF